MHPQRSRVAASDNHKTHNIERLDRAEDKNLFLRLKVVVVVPHLQLSLFFPQLRIKLQLHHEALRRNNRHRHHHDRSLPRLLLLTLQMGQPPPSSIVRKDRRIQPRLPGAPAAALLMPFSYNLVQVVVVLDDDHPARSTHLFCLYWHG